MRKQHLKQYLPEMWGTGLTYDFQLQASASLSEVLGPVLQITVVHIIDLYFDLILHSFKYCLDFSAILTTEERRQGANMSVITE